MTFPRTRLRRLRRTGALRSLVRETRLHPENFVMPMFIVPGKNIRKEISSLPGMFHLSIDRAVEDAKATLDAGIKAVLLFAIPEKKDDTGEVACAEHGIIQETIKTLKAALPELVVITDLCFCEYTTHGHCGALTKDGHVDNDATLELIVRQTLSHAAAGADIIAQSGMMDGAVGKMRDALESKGFTDTAIMSYSAKFSSSFYGPFREAVQSAPSFGDRKAYQMSYTNGREALREIELDIAEGADIVMVKPALAYLDIIARARDAFSVPIAAYHVSGEYAMIKAAAAKGLIDEQQGLLESVYAMHRAGADIIISYFARDFAKLWKQGLV